MERPSNKGRPVRTRNVIISPKTAIFLTICLALGFVAGLLVGTSFAWKACVDIGLNFLNVNGVELNINEDLLIKAVNHYKSSLGGWLFDEESPFNIR